MRVKYPYIFIILALPAATYAAATLRMSPGSSVTLPNTPASLFDTVAAQTIVVYSSDGSPLNFRLGVPDPGSCGRWFSAGPQSGTTPATISFFLNDSTCPNTQGSLSIVNTTPGGVGDTLTVPVTYNPAVNGTGAGSPSFAIDRNAVLVQAAPGQNGGGWLTLSSNSFAPVGFTVNVPTEYNWLAATPHTSEVDYHNSAMIQVSAWDETVTGGQQLQGSFTLHPDNGAPDITVYVTLIAPLAAAGPTISATPSAATIVYSAGSNPQIYVSCTNQTYSAQTTTSWLRFDDPPASPAMQATGLPSNSNLPLGLNPYVVAGMASGTYTGTVTLVNPADLSQATVTITLVLNLPPPDFSISISPPSLQFTASAEAEQTISVTSAAKVYYTATTQTFNGGNAWLGINPTGIGHTPAQVTVMVGPAVVQPGAQYTGEVDFSIAATGAVVRLPVTLTVPPAPPTGNLSVLNNSGAHISSLAFSVRAGGAVSTQDVTIAGAIAGIPFSFQTSAPWLSLNSNQSGWGKTPLSASITVDPAALSAGTQNATITLLPQGGSAVTIPVSVTVAAPAASITAGPSSLGFVYNIGDSGPTPLSSTITVSGTAGAQFTATVSSTGDWLALSAASGTIPASGSVPLTVSLQNLGSLAVSGAPYMGVITVAGAAGAAGSTVISVSLTVAGQLPTILSVTNAASFNSGPLAAGELITIFGTQLGPAVGVQLTTTAGGTTPKELGGVSVLVGGYPAPVLFASATQVSAIVPYEVDTPAAFLKNIPVGVKYLGQSSNFFPETQVAAEPGIFTADSSGSGQGAILNSDLSLNCACSSGRPASVGETVVLYVTGEGQTTPAGGSGIVTPVEGPYPQPVQEPKVTINGQPAQVQFYGEAPGLVAGALQINVVVPDGAASGQANPVVVSFSGTNSQMTPTGVGAVTVAVK